MSLTDLDSALENSVKRSARGRPDRFELQQWCQLELSQVLAELVNFELSQNGDALSNEAILTRVINSSAYQTASRQIHSKMVSSLAKMKEKYENSRPGTFSGDVSFDSLPSSSISSSRSMFCTREQLTSLYSNIETEPFEAMTRLVKLCGDNPIEELFRQELESKILFALKSEAYDVTCQFLAKVMSNANQNEVRRAHSVAAAFLIEENTTRIQLVRLLNELYCDLHLVWNRYPPDAIRDIVEKCFEVFSQKRYYSAISQIDSNAKWYKSWTHAHNSRAAIIASFKKNSTFIGNAVEIIKNFELASPDENLPFATVIHSFRILQYSLVNPSFHQFLPGLNDLMQIIAAKCLGDRNIHKDLEQAAFDVFIGACERQEIANKVFTEDMLKLLIDSLPAQPDRLSNILSAVCSQHESIRDQTSRILISKNFSQYASGDDYQSLLAVLFQSHLCVNSLRNREMPFTTDQLLSLAQTGSGLALVHQCEGALPLARLLQSRLKHKLGKKGELFERFGCGYLLTFLAATEFGTRALIKADYSKLVVSETWQLVQSLPSLPDHGERARKKAQNVLGNLLSSATSVRCFITQSQGEDEPKTIFGLFHALLDPSKAENLYCQIDALTFALEMILQLSKSIESFLYFEEQLNLTKTLQLILRESTNLDCNVPLIKNILANSTSINGLSKPSQKNRLMSATRTKRPKLPVVKDLNDLKQHIWRYMSSQKSDQQLIVHYVKKWLTFVKGEKVDTKQNGKPSKIFGRCNEMVYNYVREYGAVDLKKADFDRFMRQRQSGASYDWLCALIVLLLDDKDLADKVLAASHVTWQIFRKKSPYSALLTKIGDWVDRICRTEMAQLHSSFVFSGFPVSVITQLWLEQCFLNYLPFDTVQKFIVALIIIGPEMGVYFTCAVIKSNLTKCIDSQINQDLARMLKQSPTENFDLGKHVPYMRQLHKTYGADIQVALQT